MAESTTNTLRRQYTPYASLVALGVYLTQQQVLQPLCDEVQIAQKTVRYTPTDKLLDAVIALLAGAHGLVEINTVLRSEPALQAAFGRTACAEQSVVQDTLDACTAANVAELQRALTTIFRRQSQSYRHDFSQQELVLDADLSGLPCGPKAELASKGYFRASKARRGRQLLRVVASPYQEIVVDQLLAGTANLSTNLPSLLEAAEAVLDLTPSQRQQTIVRLDAGGGSVADINWLLDRGYQVHAKDYAAARVAKLAAPITEWVDDPCVPGRQVAWVTTPCDLYHRPVRRIIARCREHSGRWSYGVIVSSVSAATIERLLQDLLAARHIDQPRLLLAYVYFYDQRGGGVETSFKGSKQGLNLGHRNKKRIEAQRMLLGLALLVYNLLLWARRWLAPQRPQLLQFGIRRLIRDVLHITGYVVRDAQGQIVGIGLNQRSHLAQQLANAFRQLLAGTQVDLILGET
jgi:hypothetical protein